MRVIENQPYSYGDSIPCPFPTTTSAFYHQVLTHPDIIAVRDRSDGTLRQYTYRELGAFVQHVTKQLRALGVQPNQRLPLVMKRGVEMIIGIFAILSCGAQYVPLDGSVVADSTLRHVVEECGKTLIVCVPSSKQRIDTLLQGAKTLVIDSDLWGKEISADDIPVNLATPISGCYVIYTSGTTGKPKGVDVSHDNVTNLVCLSPGNLGITPGTRVGHVLNVSFDMAAWEIFACLCNGGTLVIRGSDWASTVRELDVLICTPTILSKYSPVEYQNIKVVATAGEPTTQHLADTWATHATYWNCCGPTEVTIVNTMSKHVAGTPVSIGKPTPNNSVYILDENLRPVPHGEAGYLWAGGRGVTRGYVGLDAKTRECYVPDRFANDGSRMYFTGDLGFWNNDGSIAILGRCDDQVKVKGFRVELDGISSSLLSAPRVTQAVTLFIDGQIHAFVAPLTVDAAIILEHLAKLQPYYAIPSQVHKVPEFPVTANGKIDKKSLRETATTHNISEKQSFYSEYKNNALTETHSLSPASTRTASIKDVDVLKELPEKTLAQPFRGLLFRVFIIYRTLFTFTTLLNVTVLAILLVYALVPSTAALMTAANLVLCVAIRQDLVINALYTALCSVSKKAPLWIRRRCAKVYHLGGVHSAAGVCATLWLLCNTATSTYNYVARSSKAESVAEIILSWMLSFICCSICAVAYPSFRKQYHNTFEMSHRFLGWTALLLFWARTMLSAHHAASAERTFASTLVHDAGFWLLTFATISIASSWFFLRKVPVESTPLSNHAIMLTFRYTLPVNGSFTRISNRPLLEWHSFATIPKYEEKGYSLIVSGAGDWTKACIRRPPTSVWVRGLPACGVMRIATLFNRVVVIATGSGIGPLLGHISRPTCETQLLWSTSRPQETFGQGVLDTIHKTLPNAIIHDTQISGRPDLTRMGYNLAVSFRAEAVIIIANEKITKKVVYGLESRGVPAYGAIWDS